MQTQQTITLFGTVSNTATSRTSKTGRKYTAFGVSMIYDRNRQEFSYNVVAWGKQGHFAKSLQKGTRIKLVIHAQSQPPTPPTLRATVTPGRTIVGLSTLAREDWCVWSVLFAISSVDGLFEPHAY
jgi:hypothetical protein